MSAYRMAVVLSGASAALGLLREVLIVGRLGLGPANDLLQFALSITYTISLLGDPLRLASLNLIGRRLALASALGLAGLILVAVAGTTIAYAAGGPRLPMPWVVAAGLAGGANLFVAWAIPRRLSDSPFLRVHALTVLPNAVIVAGLLVPSATDTRFAERVVFLFLLAPAIQLAGLRLLRRSADQPARTASGVPDLVRAVGWHGVGAAGGMATQFLIRSVLTAVPGTLSAFTLMLRITETLRAVFVDSWVASRVRRWSEEGAAAAVRSAAGVFPWAAAIAVVGVGLAVALRWPGADGTLLAPAAVVLVVGLYPVVAYRVGWQALNTSGPPRGMLARVAGLEWAVAGAGMLLAATGVHAVALLPWLAYVVRPAAGVRLLAGAATGGS